MEKGIPMVASASTAEIQVLYTCMFLNMINMGVSSTDTGSICVTRKDSSITFLPLKRYFAIP